MNMVFPLNDEAQVAAKAGGILARTELSIWMNSALYAAHRDMSQSRRTLLRAWCRKVLAGERRKRSKPDRAGYQIPSFSRASAPS